MTLPIVTLTPNDSGLKIGDAVPLIEPNVHDSCILADRDGTQVGLFLTTLPKDLLNLMNIADTELRSKRVPKSDMRRSSGLHNQAAEVKQYSAILGSCPPKPHMRRPYPSRSSVHGVKTAKTFCRVMSASISLQPLATATFQQPFIKITPTLRVLSTSSSPNAAIAQAVTCTCLSLGQPLTR
jgi:hypothetical protein